MVSTVKTKNPKKEFYVNGFSKFTLGLRWGTVVAAMSSFVADSFIEALLGDGRVA